MNKREGEVREGMKEQTNKQKGRNEEGDKVLG